MQQGTTYRSAHATLRAASPEGLITAVVSAFGLTDSYGTRAPREFWAKAFANRANPKIVWAHDWARPIGRVVGHEILEPGDERLPELARAGGGLLISAQLNLATTDGANAFALLRDGDIDEWSFGSIRTRFAPDPTDPNVEIFAEGDVREFSPVLVGSNPGTASVSARAESASGDLPLAQHVDRALADLDALVARVGSIAQLRSTLSEVNRGRLLAVAQRASELTSKAETPPAEDADRGAADDAKTTEQRAALRRRVLKTLTQTQ